MYFNFLVEGYVDEALAKKLIHHCGHHHSGVTYGIKGWTYIQAKAKAFDQTCHGVGLLTLVDLMDTKEVCPSVVLNDWVPNRNPLHIFRVVIREAESWILADRESIAEFLAVPVVKIPDSPEELDDPKRSLINLARTSRRKAIREALVPKDGTSASEGPLYSSEITKYIAEKWDPRRASARAPSLAKSIDRLIQVI
jgi:hypothetical protein